MLHNPSKNKRDIAADLCKEIDNVVPYISSKMNALNVIQYLFANNLIFGNSHSNVNITCKTVISWERSFSKLKIIKELFEINNGTGNTCLLLVLKEV